MLESITFAPDVIHAAANALLPCMSAGDKLRHYLEGVFLHDNGDARTYSFVATDGHRLGLFKAECIGFAPGVFGDAGNEGFKLGVLLPRDAVAYLASIKPKKAIAVKLHIGEAGEDEKRPLSVEVFNEGGADELRRFTIPAPHNGVYAGGEGWVDYQRVMPHEVLEPQDAYSAAYIEQMAKAAQKAGAQCLALAPNAAGSGGPSRFYTDKEGLSYVLMPRRAGDAIPTATPFEKQPVAVQLEQAKALFYRAQNALDYDARKEARALMEQMDILINKAKEG